MTRRKTPATSADEVYRNRSSFTRYETRGRKARPARTVVLIQERNAGKRRHLYTLTLDVHPSEVHKLLHTHFAGKLTH
jgi:hypothetical protein